MSQSWLLNLYLYNDLLVALNFYSLLITTKLIILSTLCIVNLLFFCYLIKNNLSLTHKLIILSCLYLVNLLFFCYTLLFNGLTTYESIIQLFSVAVNTLCCFWTTVVFSHIYLYLVTIITLFIYYVNNLVKMFYHCYLIYVSTMPTKCNLACSEQLMAV